MANSISAANTINGLHGKLFLMGGDTPVWMANVLNIKAKLNIEKKAIKIPGIRETGYKAGYVSGEGSISQYKMTSKWIREIGRYQRDLSSGQPVYTLRYELTDPEAFHSSNNAAYGEVIELTGVRFWDIDLGYTNDEIEMEDLSFTFQNHNLVYAINQSLNEIMNYDSSGTEVAEV